MRYSHARLRRRRGRGPARGARCAEVDRERGTRRQPRLLLRRPAERDRDARRRDRRAARRRRAGSRLIIEKPFGHDLASARELNARIARALRRERGLPDRPLPRQGDGAEHAGAAVRERHLRADLEPAVHRPRADHRRRVDRDRGPRRVLRAVRRDPRHLPEPPAAARRDHRDGAADRLHRRTRSATRRSRCCGAAHARPEVGRPRPVRAAGSSRARRCRATARRTASRPTR